jgi:hypothetical protein
MAYTDLAAAHIAYDASFADTKHKGSAAIHARVDRLLLGKEAYEMVRDAWLVDPSAGRLLRRRLWDAAKVDAAREYAQWLGTLTPSERTRVDGERAAPRAPSAARSRVRALLYA